MNCEEARLHIGADPAGCSASLDAHLQSCPACSGFQREMVALEVDIRRALQLQPPLRANAPAGVPPAMPAVSHGRSRPLSRYWALAASVVVTVALGVLLWGLQPADALAEDVIEHLGGEPQSWSYTESMAQPSVNERLGKAGVTLDAAQTDVVYAMSCWFRGRYVPHLVVRTAAGAFTVLVLPGEIVPARERLAEGPYQGILLPASGGSIAVAAREPTTEQALDEVARKVFAALHWTPGAAQIRTAGA